MKITRLFTILFALLLAMAVNAKDYDLTVGENVLTGFDSANGMFTPNQDCKVLIEAQEVLKVSYNGKEYAYSYVPGSGFAYTFEVDGVKAGETVYVTSDFVWNSKSKVRITTYADGGAIPVEALAVSPKAGEVFNWNSSGNVTINFNKNVSLSSLKLKSGDNVVDVDDVRLGSSVGFNVTNALNAMLKEGKLNPGETFQIVLAGLRDAADKENLYNGDGNFVIEYKAPYPQYDVVKATVGDYQLSYTQANTYEFLSYYSPDGEDGLFVIEFEGDIKSVGSVNMSMGNLDLIASGKYHRSELPYKIDGKKLLIDARGKLRTLAVLFPAVMEEETEEGGEAVEGIGSYDTEHVTIAISNIIDVNGNAFRTNLPGSVGSFSFVMNYKELVDEAFIDGDNKSEGDAVKGCEEVSLWLSNPDIKFDGLEVSYYVESANPTDELSAQEQRTEVVKNFTSVPDAVEGAIITFKMPEMAGVVAGTTVRVALANASSADGMPHYLYIEFKADGMADCIKGVSTNACCADGIYTLSGAKVSKAEAKQRGIFVVNGKKTLIR